MNVEALRRFIRVLLGGAFIWVGIYHFTNVEFFLAIMPPYLPWHIELVYISGFFEIIGGAGLIFPPTRTVAMWGLLALLAAVYPANVHMLVNEVYIDGMPQEKWMLWARMPLQFILAFAVYWSGKSIRIDQSE